MLKYVKKQYCAHNATKKMTWLFLKVHEMQVMDGHMPFIRLTTVADSCKGQQVCYITSINLPNTRGAAQHLSKS